MLTASSHTGFGYSLEISFEDGSLPLTTERKCDKHDISRRCQFHYRGCSWYWQTTPSGKKRDVVWCLANFTQTMTVWKEKKTAFMHWVKRITSFWREKSNISLYYLYAQIAFVMVFDLNHAIYHAHMSGHWHQTWWATSWCNIFEFKWYLRATPEVFSKIPHNSQTYEFRRLEIYNTVQKFEVSRIYF